jgi:hypothetical protein
MKTVGNMQRNVRMFFTGQGIELINQNNPKLLIE